MYGHPNKKNVQKSSKNLKSGPPRFPFFDLLNVLKLSQSVAIILGAFRAQRHPGIPEEKTIYAPGFISIHTDKILGGAGVAINWINLHVVMFH